jgi:predicted porin
MSKSIRGGADLCSAANTPGKARGQSCGSPSFDARLRPEKKTVEKRITSWRSSVPANLASLAVVITLVLIPFGSAGSARAGDVGTAIKSTAANGLPPLTWNGVTLYGNLDYSLQYQSNGVAIGPTAYTSTGGLFAQNKDRRWELAPNQSSLTFVGMKFEEGIAADTKIIGKFESGFVPTTGRNDDLLKAMRNNNGLPITQQKGAVDGTRAGQFLDGQAYGGFQNPIYGTITAGRQFSLAADAMPDYDPLFSYGFSLIGFYGTAAGMGAIETVVLDRSVRYTKKAGRFIFAGLFANPGTNVKQTYQARLGFQRGGFQIDALGSHSSDTIAASALSSALPGAVGSPYLGAKVSDATTWAVFAKQRIALQRAPLVSEVAGRGIPFSPNLTFSAGYENIRLSNPADGGISAGHKTIGGYALGPAIAVNGLASFGIVNDGYTGGDRILSVPFATMRFQWTPKWSISAGYYQQRSNSWGFGLNASSKGQYSAVRCSDSQHVNCSGHIEEYALRVLYAFNRNISLYSGATRTALYGGSRSGFLSHRELAFTNGLRLSF